MLSPTHMRRRKSSEAAAIAITQNGNVTAAITKIGAESGIGGSTAPMRFVELTEPPTSEFARLDIS